ncbi:hypothetical protein Taro_022822 [Colocasia esculenta]|uniref:PWI domain-containing protein n=1 Tax=Colocasia esculenta TaxID=4460 RepID=A0A843V2Y7_COLES|nr:hypothetical protein [Colocasia esculenta]
MANPAPSRESHISVSGKPSCPNGRNGEPIGLKREASVLKTSHPLSLLLFRVIAAAASAAAGNHVWRILPGTAPSHPEFFALGTSADQDTRFSNKQAKLLKTQKFAPELDHLVDMTKVKMDVMKPWIARRVTELLGFEDEVLINFVYGLLDAKEVDGKQIQIQLTGFMEKNTGKFMREMWGLLLSAQKNASGVPQQFLDEKEEEMRKKKVESDRITQEIQKKKDRDGLEPDYAKQKRMLFSDYLGSFLLCLQLL